MVEGLLFIDWMLDAHRRTVGRADDRTQLTMLSRRNLVKLVLADFRLADAVDFLGTRPVNRYSNLVVGQLAAKLLLQLSDHRFDLAAALGEPLADLRRHALDLKTLGGSLGLVSESVETARQFIPIDFRSVMDRLVHHKSFQRLPPLLGWVIGAIE